MSGNSHLTYITPKRNQDTIRLVKSWYRGGYEFHIAESRIESDNYAVKVGKWLKIQRIQLIIRKTR